MSLERTAFAKKRNRFLAGFLTLLTVTLIAIGIFAKNGWLPSTGPLPTPTPQLSKEYIYVGSRLLAVEDANANAVAPADLAIWRPSTGTWWVMGGAAGSQPATQAWGASTDKPVPGDYDGDGKTDFSVFRPSTGEWYVLQSSDGAWSVWTWGLSTDVRVPADYDGDGKTDRAVWRPSDGFWYVVRSSDTVILYQPYGTNGDVPAPADYDGDGRADLAVWRNSDQKFYALGSADSRSAVVSMGQASTQPVSGDYDGDGKADHAIRNSTNWIIRQSSNGQVLSIPWQKATDTAVQNDYDADGKVDVAVWRPNNSPPGTVGNWFIRQSAFGNSLRQVAWGTSGDWPVPALYRR